MKTVARLRGCIGIFALLATIFAASLAFANPDSSNADTQGPQFRPAPITVAEAKKAHDDSMVLLNGFIIKHLGDRDYLFKDNSGEIQIEVDSSLVKGVTASTPVTIYGKMDVEEKSTTIEVQEVTIKK